MDGPGGSSYGFGMLLSRGAGEVRHSAMAMGEMASTLAHELNQPLAAISNYLQGSRLLLQDSTDERAQLIMEALDKAGEQAGDCGSASRLEYYLVYIRVAVASYAVSIRCAAASEEFSLDGRTS